MIDAIDEDKVSESSGNETNLLNPSASKKSTWAGYLILKGAKRGDGNTKKDVKDTKGFNYLTLDTKKAFNYLCHAFTQASILSYFDFEQHIRIETNALGYAISGVLCQLILGNLGQWHLVAYYSRKMILAKTRYKTHNNEILAIVQAFKT